MKALALRRINKPYFGHEDIARILNISPQSARVSATRYVKAGTLVRIKRNIYVLQEAWAALGIEQKFAIANLIQTPSYVSLTTALEFFQITTQMQHNYVESIALRRTREVAVGGTTFTYRKIAPGLYGGFVKRQGFFIAEPEKALLDALYLMSLGRYRLDVSAIDFSKLRKEKLDQWLESFPSATGNLLVKNEHP